MRVFREINEAIERKLQESYGDINIQAINEPLYQTSKNLVYYGNGVLNEFYTDDNYSLQIGHNWVSGKQDHNKPVWQRWTHEIEMILIGKHEYLVEVIEALESQAITLTRYDLNTKYILQNYFRFMEDYPDMQAFTLRYTFHSNLREVEEQNCNPC